MLRPTQESFNDIDTLPNAGEGLPQILTHARHLGPFSSEDSLTCHGTSALISHSEGQETNLALAGLEPETSRSRRS